jgi:hypothetical protein
MPYLFSLKEFSISMFREKSNLGFVGVSNSSKPQTPPAPFEKLRIESTLILHLESKVLRV